jgi:ribose-phosphate pyrophosphokinase
MIEEKLKTNEKPLFFSLGANPSLAERISALSSIPLSPVKIAHFADGESFLKPLCPVEGKECFVLQSTASPVNERLMELAIFVDALHHAKAAKITLLVPYFGYARQDRIIDEGDPISGLLAEKMLQGAGADKLVVVDFHSEKLFNQFTLPHENLTAIPSFAQRLHQEIASQGKNSSTNLPSPTRI